MKWSQCGCEKLDLIEFPVQVFEGDGGFTRRFETYACRKCGHLELFQRKYYSLKDNKVVDTTKNNF